MYKDMVVAIFQRSRLTQISMVAVLMTVVSRLLTKVLNLTSLTVFSLVSSGSFALVAANVATDANDTRELSSSSLSITDQRYHYQLAKNYLAKDQIPLFQKHYALAQGYALLPYLDYSLLKSNLNSLPKAEVDEFLTAHSDSFLGKRLSQQWLYTLAVKQEWEQFLAYYQPNLGMTELECYNLYARIKTGDTTAYGEVADIWAVGKSRPKACDPLFNAWRKQGGITDAIAWQRFNAAMNNNKRSLARYVTRFMSDDYKAYADLFDKVHGYPYSIRNTKTYREQSDPMQDIIAYGVRRYARSNPKDAMGVWDKFETQHLFTQEQAVETKLYIIKRLAYKGHSDLAESWIRNSSELREKNVMEALLRDSLKQQDWDKVALWTELATEELMQEERWQYWRARAQDELGLETGPMGTSADIYHNLSGSRSFYGFLAADATKQPYSLKHKRGDIDPNLQSRVENLGAIQRAKELWLNDSLREANAEWYFAMTNLNEAEILAAGDLARRWGWHNQAIKSMIYSEQWDQLDIRFPIAYQDEINEIATKTQLEPTLIYAVTRQESAFAETARSPTNARGLMQLMPATAKQTARRSGIKHSLADLYNPEHNIQLGSHYLSELLEKFDGNRILAAAAYNAGPHRVSRWLKEHEAGVPYDIWIETIPFKETRGYVQNVLAFSVIYGYRLGQPSTMLNERELGPYKALN